MAIARKWPSARNSSIARFVEAKKEMKKVLGEIQDGTFASRWITENKSGGKAHFLATRDIEAASYLEQVGKEVRDLYSWNKEDKYSETK